MHPSTRQHYVDAAEDARRVFGAFDVALRFVGVTAEVFLRRGFGERYLTPGLLLGAGLFLLALAAWIGGVSMDELPRSSPGTLLFLGAFIGFAVGRRAEVVRRCRSGHAWHSWCDGTPWRTWGRIGVSPDAARSVAEPLLVLAISLAALCAGDRAFSGSLMVVSTAMFLKEQRTRTRRREVWLDAQDRQIEDEELSAVASGANTLGASRGFAIPGLQRLPTSSRREIAARLRPVGDPVLAPPKARAIRTTPKPELAAPDAPPVAAPVYPPVDPPVAAAVPLERGISPVFLTVELVPLPPAHVAHVARAAGAGHGSIPSPRDPAVQESGGAVNGEAVPESVVGEEGLGKEPLPEEEAVVRGDALQREVAREPSADEGTARSRSSFGADTDAYREAAPPRDSDEEAWVDAFATFRSRARRSRDAASEFDPSDIERN